MKKALKFSFLLFVLLSCVGCDQVTKSIAKKLLLSSVPIPVLNGFIRFEYVENAGAFLSLGDGLPEGFRFLLFVVIAGALLALMPLLVIKESNVKSAQLIGLALLTGGGVGNLIDRIINNGRVVDFVSIGIGSIRTGIFNMADVAVMAGALILIAGLIMHKESQSNHLKNDPF